MGVTERVSTTAALSLTSTNDSCNIIYLPPSACSLNGHHNAAEAGVEWLFRLSSGSEGIMRFSQSSAILGNRDCKKKRKGVNGKELNNGDVEIVLVAHPFMRAHAVDQWQRSSRVSL